MVVNKNIILPDGKQLLEILPEGHSIKLSFHNINKNDFIIKLNSYNGKFLYNYTSTSQSEINNLKFPVEEGKTYYIWECDKNLFEDMDEQDQLQYLKNNVFYNGLNIGCIETDKINDILFDDLIRSNTEYTFNIHESQKYSYKWIRACNDNVEFSLLVNKLLSGNTVVEVNSKFIIENTEKEHSSLGNDLIDILHYMKSNSGIKLSYRESNNNLGDLYENPIIVYIDDKQYNNCPLFSIYQVKNKIGVRLIVDKELVNMCKVSKVDSRILTNMEGVNEFIQSLCNDIKNNKVTIYYSIINDLNVLFR